MVYLGCHLSSGKGFRAMVRTAESIGADTFAYFTRNPRGSKGKDPDKNDIAAALAETKEQGFGKLVAHGAYTMNLCTADPEARAFAASVLADDLRRMADLPGQFYNFHPGSHVGQGTETGRGANCLGPENGTGAGLSCDGTAGDHGREGQ